MELYWQQACIEYELEKRLLLLISFYYNWPGWGRNESNSYNSDELQKVALDLIDNNDCQNMYAKTKFTRTTIDSNQMCAGGFSGDDERDTCKGDSGGPIMITKQDNDCLFYVVGKHRI